MTTQLHVQPETSETESRRKLREAQECYLEEQRADVVRGKQAALEVPAQRGAARPVGFWTIAFAVLAANVMTGVIAAILYALTR